jgi:phosphatidylserine synthase
MFDLELRHVKDFLLKFVVVLIPNWMTPNMLTTIGLIAGLLCSYYTALGEIKCGMYLWFLNRILDGLDGVVARERKL